MTDPTREEPASAPGGFRVTGHWARDWRVGGNLVGKGELRMDAHGLRLVAGRTGVVRGVLLLVARLLAWAGFFGACGAAALTAIGLTVRTRAPEWLGAAVIAIPVAMGLSMLFAWLARRMLEGRKTLTLPWSAVERVGAGRGPWLHLAVRDGRRLRVGRFKARRYPAELRQALHRLREGHPPTVAPAGVTVGTLRSPWPDKLVVWSGLAAATAGLVVAWPTVRDLLDGPPTHGPAAGVPERADAAELETSLLADGAACPKGPPGAPAVRNRQLGDDLQWRWDPAPGWTLVHARIDAADDGHRVSLAGRGEAAEGRLADALADGPATILSLVVAEDGAARVAAALEAGDLQDAMCSGQVSRLDRTVPPGREPSVELSLTRDGGDLVVQATGSEDRLVVLAARQRDQRRADWFDRCELAVYRGDLVLPRLADQDGTALRLPAFFGSSRDEARVVALPRKQAGALRARLGAAEHLPCWQVDALSWLGPGVAWATTSRAPDALAAAAADRTRADGLLSAGGSAADLPDDLHQRYLAVVGALSPRGRAEWQSVDEGFLDGLPWSAILDRLSMQHDLPQLERSRQRLSGADGQGSLGELFLLRLAEEFLERIPPEASLSQYDSRVEVAEAWLDVDGGTTWSPGGRTVTVPGEEVAAYYQVVGHYLLVDVARRAEAHMGRSLAFRVVGLPLKWELENHGINLDVEKSSAQKALEAWVKGDFEYLGDRALARLQEQVADQAEIIAAASSAEYRLTTQWSAGDGAARVGPLLRDGREIGWVALYDASAVRVGYHDVQARGIDARDLGGGRTPLLAAAGSYVTASNDTAGLSAVDGNVENFLISNKMDGLVIVTADGRMSTLDMRHGGTLPGQQRPLRPLESLADLHSLLRWLDDHDASAFQTHLLGAGGQLTIDEATASPTLRERRLLVQAAYDGHPIIAVVDLPGSPKVSLFEAAVIAVQALRTPQDAGGPGLDVLSIANLDVGSYNALQAWDDGGRTLRQSWKPLGETMNLVSIGRR